MPVAVLTTVNTGDSAKHRALDEPGTVTKGVTRVAVAGAIAFGGALGSAAVAAAIPGLPDVPPMPGQPGSPALPGQPGAAAFPGLPDPSVDRAVPFLEPAVVPGEPRPEGVPPPSTIGTPLAQFGQRPTTEGSPVPAAGLSDPLALLDPSKTLGTPPTMQPWNNTYLLPQYEKPSAPGTGAPLDNIAPGQEKADVPIGKFIDRVRVTYDEGKLTGGFLGQRPQESLGQPLPDTAPPPGTAVPPGLDKFYEPPPPPGAPPPPVP